MKKKFSSPTYSEAQLWSPSELLRGKIVDLMCVCVRKDPPQIPRPYLYYWMVKRILCSDRAPQQRDEKSRGDQGEMFYRQIDLGSKNVSECHHPPQQFLPLPIPILLSSSPSSPNSVSPSLTLGRSLRENVYPLIKFLLESLHWRVVETEADKRRQH